MCGAAVQASCRRCDGELTHVSRCFYEAIQCMRAKSVRRLPVVAATDGGESELTGIVTLNDLLRMRRVH